MRYFKGGLCTLHCDFDGRDMEIITSSTRQFKRKSYELVRIKSIGLGSLYIERKHVHEAFPGNPLDYLDALAGFRHRHIVNGSIRCYVSESKQAEVNRGDRIARDVVNNVRISMGITIGKQLGHFQLYGVKPILTGIAMLLQNEQLISSSDVVPRFWNKRNGHFECWEVASRTPDDCISCFDIARMWEEFLTRPTFNMSVEAPTTSSGYVEWLGAKVKTSVQLAQEVAGTAYHPTEEEFMAKREAMKRETQPVAPVIPAPAMPTVTVPEFRNTPEPVAPVTTNTELVLSEDDAEGFMDIVCYMPKQKLDVAALADIVKQYQKEVEGTKVKLTITDTGDIRLERRIRAAFPMTANARLEDGRMLCMLADGLTTLIEARCKALEADKAIKELLK